MLSGCAAKRESEDRRPVEVLGQLARLFLQAGLDLAEALDPARWATVNLPWAFCRSASYEAVSETIFSCRSASDLSRSPMRASCSTASCSSASRRACSSSSWASSSSARASSCFLAGLVAIVLIELALRLLHPAPGVFTRPRGPVGAQLGQPLELPLEVFADLRLLFRQPLELVLALLGIGVALGFPRLFQVLGLPGARLGQLALGILQLFHQPGELSLAAVLDRVDQVSELFARLLLLRGGPAPSGSFPVDRPPRPACRRSLAARSSERPRASPQTPADPDSSIRPAISAIRSCRFCNPLPT